MAPRGDELRVPKRDRVVFLLDQRGVYVIGLPVQHDRRSGFRFYIDLVEFPLAIGDERGQLVRRQRLLNPFLEAMPRAHIAVQNVGCLLRLNGRGFAHRVPLPKSRGQGAHVVVKLRFTGQPRSRPRGGTGSGGGRASIAGPVNLEYARLETNRKVRSKSLGWGAGFGPWVWARPS